MSLRTTAATLCLVALAGAAACSEDEGATDPSPTTAESPADTTTTTIDPGTAGPGDGEWEVVEPEAVGLDAAVLEELAAEAETDGSNCLLVVRDGRSEERTSELQSLMRISYAVFCLKKKKHSTKQQDSI